MATSKVPSDWITVPPAEKMPCSAITRALGSACGADSCVSWEVELLSDVPGVSFPAHPASRERVKAPARARVSHLRCCFIERSSFLLSSVYLLMTFVPPNTADMGMVSRT